MHIKAQHNLNELEKSTKELSLLSEELLDLALKAGASAAAVSVNHDRGFHVDVRMGSVETLAFSEDKGLALTLYLGAQKGSATSTDSSPEALRALVKAAYEIALVSAADPCFGLADKDLMRATYPDLDLFHPWQLEPREAINKAIACEDLALASDKRITNSDGCSVSSYESHHAYANTHGARGLVHSSRHSMSCSLIAEEGKSMQRDYEYTSARDAAALMSEEALALSAAARAVSRLGARQIKTQKAPVLFSPRVSSSIFSSFIHAISGSNLYKKNSFLLDSQGKQLFPDFVRIYEQPFLKGALGSAAFDSEGVPTRENVLVEGGILKQYVLGSYSARKLGLKSTANADGVHNLSIDPNALSFEALCARMDRGFLVTELMGQGVNVLTGDYSRGAAGFWVEGGVIQYPVDQVTIAANLKDMFAMLLGIGPDRNPNLSTRCGSLLIEEMMIAGA